MVSLNAMSINCIYLHYCYPNGEDNREEINYTMWVDEKDFSNGWYYTDETKSEAKAFNSYEYPTYEDYEFEGFFDDNQTINSIFDLGDRNMFYPRIAKGFTFVKVDRPNAIKSDLSGMCIGDSNPIIHLYAHWKKIDSTTDINQIESNTQTEEIYTIGGVKVKEITQSGLYIINGKKVFVKK